MNDFRIIFLILVIIFIAILVIRLFTLKKKSFDRSDFKLVDIGEDITLKEVATVPNEPITVELADKQTEDNLSPRLDVVGLLHWYHDRANKHKNSLRGAINCLYLYFTFLVIMFLHKATPIFTYGGLPRTYPYWELIPSALIVLYYIRSKFIRIADIMDNSRYVELNEKQFPKIWSACYQIMQRMQLSYKLRIYYVKKDKAEASVIFERDTIYLMLSRGMITYSQINFKDVESIIGHELGHICQGDTKMMLIGKRTMQLPLILMALFMVLSSFKIFDPSNEFIQFQIGMGMNFFIPFFCLLFVVQRREAEYLADMASLIFVDNSTICDLVERHLPRMGNLNYPSRKRRIVFIRKWIAKYNKYNQPFPVIPQPVISHSGS